MRKLRSEGTLAGELRVPGGTVGTASSHDTGSPAHLVILQRS